MRKESLDQFIQKMKDSEQLQARIGEAIETDALIALETDHGCEFSAEDVDAVWGVSDDDLDGVVGGAAYIKFDGVRGGFAVGKRLRRSHQISGSGQADGVPIEV